MLGNTQNTETLPVPQVQGEVATPTPEAKPTPPVKPKFPKGKPRDTSKAKRTETSLQLAVKQAVSQWKHGVAPESVEGLGVKIQRYGEETGRVNKKGEKMRRGTMAVITPTASKIREDNPTMTVAESVARQNEIGQAIKPIVMARVAAAGSSAKFIVRRYTETPNDKGKNKLSVTLEQINVENTLERIARELKMSVQDVAKRLGVPLPKELTLEA